MVEILCSKSSISADTAFRKFTRPGCTNSNTHTINLGKTKSKPNEVFTTEQSQDSKIFQGATPDSETDSRFATMAVNNWEPESVTGLVDTAKTLRLPKQYSVLLA